MGGIKPLTGLRRTSSGVKINTGVLRESVLRISVASAKAWEHSNKPPAFETAKHFHSAGDGSGADRSAAQHSPARQPGSLNGLWVSWAEERPGTALGNAPAIDTNSWPGAFSWHQTEGWD